MSRIDELIQKWDADLYDQEEIQTDDIDFMLEIIGPEKKNILEVCCGSGRILVPMARAGHLVTGFDINEYMMEKIEDKAKGLHNINWYKNDAVKDDWGNKYDVVVLAGNILINIETEIDYKEAQILFIQKAYDSLKQGGYVYLDFNLFLHPEKFFGKIENRVIFEGEDSNGNYGTIKILKGTYNCNTQICSSEINIAMRMAAGEVITKSYMKIKHIPTLEDIKTWLAETGFIIEEIYGNYLGDEISDLTDRAIIWARKVR